MCEIYQFNFAINFDLTLLNGLYVLWNSVKFNSLIVEVTFQNELLRFCSVTSTLRGLTTIVLLEDLHSYSMLPALGSRSGPCSLTPMTPPVGNISLSRLQAGMLRGIITRREFTFQQGNARILNTEAFTTTRHNHTQR